jgi:preprotein translocase subunit SecE
MKKIIAFIQECAAELKKVTWPSKDDVVSQTIVVLASLAFFSLLLTLMDFLGNQFIVKIITLGA